VGPCVAPLEPCWMAMLCGTPDMFFIVIVTRPGVAVALLVV
jgi:hypothetical protein